MVGEYFGVDKVRHMSYTNRKVYPSNTDCTRIVLQYHHVEDQIDTMMMMLVLLFVNFLLALALSRQRRHIELPQKNTILHIIRTVYDNVLFPLC